MDLQTAIKIIENVRGFDDEATLVGEAWAHIKTKLGYNKPSIVDVAAFSGFNMTALSIFGVGPKLALECGNCTYTFRERTPFIDYPTVKCPHCGTLNRIPITVNRAK